MRFFSLTDEEQKEMNTLLQDMCSTLLSKTNYASFFSELEPLLERSLYYSSKDLNGILSELSKLDFPETNSSGILSELSKLDFPETNSSRSSSVYLNRLVERYCLIQEKIEELLTALADQVPLLCEATPPPLWQLSLWLLCAIALCNEGSYELALDNNNIALSKFYRSLEYSQAIELSAFNVIYGNKPSLWLSNLYIHFRQFSNPFLSSMAQKTFTCLPPDKLSWHLTQKEKRAQIHQSSYQSRVIYKESTQVHLAAPAAVKELFECLMTLVQEKRSQSISYFFYYNHALSFIDLLYASFDEATNKLGMIYFSHTLQIAQHNFLSRFLKSYFGRLPCQKRIAIIDADMEPDLIDAPFYAYTISSILSKRSLWKLLPLASARPQPLFYDPRFQEKRALSPLAVTWLPLAVLGEKALFMSYNPKKYLAQDYDSKAPPPPLDPAQVHEFRRKYSLLSLEGYPDYLRRKFRKQKLALKHVTPFQSTKRSLTGAPVQPPEVIFLGISQSKRQRQY